MTLADKIKKLTNAYGVSGDEFRISKIAAELMAPYCDRVEIDDFGNVLGYRDCGIPGAKTVMLDAHIDQIGFLITEVTEEGFLRFTTVGGVDQRMLLGSELTVLTKKGPILGIVAAIPPHLQKDGDDKKSVPIPEMVVDIGMTGEQAKKVVRVGDYMAFANDAMELQGDALCGKAFDDRACLVCLLHTMDLLQGKPLAVNVVLAASTKEEIGHHGSKATTYRLNPDFGIVVDVTHARTADARDIICQLGDGPNIKMGSTSDPKFARRVIELARAKQIPFTIGANPSGTGTNAWNMQVERDGVTTLVVSLPLKYMHSPVEMLRMSDVKNVGKLLAAFIETFDGRL